jgi:hypothetical protein
MLRGRATSVAARSCRLLQSGRHQPATGPAMPNKAFAGPAVRRNGGANARRLLDCIHLHAWSYEPVSRRLLRVAGKTVALAAYVDAAARGDPRAHCALALHRSVLEIRLIEPADAVVNSRWPLVDERRLKVVPTISRACARDRDHRLVRDPLHRRVGAYAFLMTDRYPPLGSSPRQGCRGGRPQRRSRRRRRRVRARRRVLTCSRAFCC